MSGRSPSERSRGLQVHDESLGPVGQRLVHWGRRLDQYAANEISDEDSHAASQNSTHRPRDNINVVCKHNRNDAWAEDADNEMTEEKAYTGCIA